MEKKHKDILVSQRVNLLENINVGEGLYSQLITRKVFNQRSIRSIQHNRTIDQQVEQLLDTLPTRGPSAFHSFCEALIADDQEHVVTLYLKPTAAKNDVNSNSIVRQESVPQCQIPTSLPEGPSSDCSIPEQGPSSNCSSSHGPVEHPRTYTHHDEDHQIYLRCYGGRNKNPAYLNEADGEMWSDRAGRMSDIRNSPQRTKNMFCKDHERTVHSQYTGDRTQQLSHPHTHPSKEIALCKDTDYSQEELDGSAPDRLALKRFIQEVGSSTSLGASNQKAIQYGREEEERIPDEEGQMALKRFISNHSRDLDSKSRPSHVQGDDDRLSPRLETRLNLKHFIEDPNYRGFNLPEPFYNKPQIQHYEKEHLISNFPSKSGSLAGRQLDSKLLQYNRESVMYSVQDRALYEREPAESEFNQLGDNLSVPAGLVHRTLREEGVGKDRSLYGLKDLDLLPSNGQTKTAQSYYPQERLYGNLAEEILHSRSRLCRNDSVDALPKRSLTGEPEQQEQPAKRPRPEEPDHLQQPSYKLTTFQIFDPTENRIISVPGVIDSPKKVTSLPVMVDNMPLRQKLQPGLGAMDDPEIDLTDGPVNVKVEMCTRQFYLSNCKDSYPMKRIPRGKALIVNVNEVVGKAARRGTNIDRDNLYNLLKQLHFDVIVYNDSDDLTAKEMARKIQAFSMLPDHAAADCTVVCLLSHGEEGFLFGTDGKKIELDAVFTQFDNNSCKHLIGKPKIFIIQACRGGALDSGVSYSVDEHDGSDPRMKQIPTMSDMVMCYPTQYGYYAWRNRDRGSWYVEALVHIFMKYAKCEDLCTMLNRVNYVVSRKISRCPNPDMDQMSQMSEFKSTLRRPHLYFFPGIGCG